VVAEGLAVAAAVVVAAIIRTCGQQAERPTSAPAETRVPAPAATDAAADRIADGSLAPRRPTAGPPLDLRFIGDGSRLVVDGRWLLDHQARRFAPLPCPVESPGANGGCACCGSPIAPDGEHALHIAEQKIEIDPVSPTEPRGAWADLPIWLDSKGKPPPPPEEVVNVGVWLSPKTVLVQQFDRGGTTGAVCRVCELPASAERACRWRRPPGGCLDADFFHLTRADAGPGGLLALHSEGEGFYALGIVLYDPDTGQADTGTPALRLEGASTVSVRFAADGARVELISPCELRDAENRRPPPCDAPFARPTWRLYSRPVGPGPIEQRRSDLPPGTVLHPDGQRFAWPADSAVCIGDPRAPAPDCVPLPR